MTRLIVDGQLFVYIVKLRDWSFAQNQEILMRCTNNFSPRTWRFPKNRISHGTKGKMEIKK